MNVIVTRNSETDELQHHGIRGQRWGIRRYQNKDGSLTPRGQKRYNKEVEKLKKETAKVKAAEKVAANKKKTQAKFDKLDAKKKALEERKKALKESEKDGDTDKNPAETAAERKARLLKSTNAKELYDNKDSLSNLELQERLNRIDLETRLSSKIVEEHHKTGWDYVDNARTKIDKATGLFKSVDGAVSTVANSYVGKTLAKNLGIELPKKETKRESLSDFLKNIDKKSDKEIQDRQQVESNKKKLQDELNRQKKQAEKEANERAQTEREANRKEAAAEAKRQVDEYNEKWQKGESDDRVTGYRTDGPYSYTQKDLSNAREDTRSSNNVPTVSSVTNTSVYNKGRDYVSNNSSKTKTTRLSDDDVEVIEPDWYKKMKQNGQI